MMTKMKFRAASVLTCSLSRFLEYGQATTGDLIVLRTTSLLGRNKNSLRGCRGCCWGQLGVQQAGERHHHCERGGVWIGVWDCRGMPAGQADQHAAGGAIGCVSASSLRRNSEHAKMSLDPLACEGRFATSHSHAITILMACAVSRRNGCYWIL